MIFCSWDPLVRKRQPELCPPPSGCWNIWGSRSPYKKTEGPSHCITFLGILIDMNAFELRLPAEKCQRLQSLLQSWSTRKSCMRRELESLLGHLSHIASIVHPGCTFLRQLFSLLHLARAPNHFILLNAGARADLKWWKCFLQNWNGSSFFPLPIPVSCVLECLWYLWEWCFCGHAGLVSSEVA